MLKNKIILCDSNISWDFNRYSKHHLMVQFAKTNNVYFVNPQVEGFNVFGSTRREEKLTIYDSLALPFKGKSEMVRRLDPIYFSWQIKKLLKGVSRKDLILFIGNPAKVFLLDVFNDCACSVYHCSDNLSVLFNGKLKEKMIKLEESLISRAGLVIAVSKPLLDKCLRLNQNSHLVENGVDEKFYLKEGEQTFLPQDLQAIKSPRIGYVGCIDRKIDFELLDLVIERHKEKSFVFIGPIHPQSAADFEKIKKHDNICYLGVKSWQILPEYVKNFDLCLIPDVVDNFTRYTSPLKLREYIAAGKIVVSTAIPIEEGLKSAVKVACDKQEFSDLIDIALSEATDPNRGQQISALAYGRSWQDKAEEISRLIEQCL